MARERFGLRMLRPADVVIHLDELVRAEAYRPAAVLDTNYRQRGIGVDDVEDLTVLANPSAGERPRDFVKTGRSLALAGCHREGIYEPARSPRPVAVGPATGRRAHRHHENADQPMAYTTWIPRVWYRRQVDQQARTGRGIHRGIRPIADPVRSDPVNGRP